MRTKTSLAHLLDNLPLAMDQGRSGHYTGSTSPGMATGSKAQSHLMVWPVYAAMRPMMAAKVVSATCRPSFNGLRSRMLWHSPLAPAHAHGLDRIRPHRPVDHIQIMHVLFHGSRCQCWLL
jgi:hypothetical protein